MTDYEGIDAQAAEALVLRLSDEVVHDKAVTSFIGDLEDGSALIAGQVAGRRVEFNGFDLRWLEPGRGYAEGERIEIRHGDAQLYFGEVTERMTGPLADCFDPDWDGGAWMYEDDDEEGDDQ